MSDEDLGAQPADEETESNEELIAEEFVAIETQSPWASLVAAAPVIAFVVVNARFFVIPETVGTQRGWFAAAVAVSAGWALASAIHRRRQGLSNGKIMPIVTAWLVFRGLVGIITANEDVYFGLSIFAKVAIGVGLIGSVLIGQPIAARVTPAIFGFSQRVQEHHAYRSAMKVLTVGAGFYEFASAGFDVWLLFIRDASANEFVLVRYVVNWGASTAALALAMWYLARQLRRIDGFPGLMAVFEAHVEAQAERMGLDLSDSK